MLTMTEDINILPLTYRKVNTGLELTFSQADDGHFVDVSIIRLKSGQAVRSHYILLADLPQWIGMHEADGWVRYNLNRKTESEQVDNQ